MKKFIKVAAMVSVISLLPISVQAAGISNGDFQSGDFSNWNVDVDGLGDELSSSDFSIVDTAAHIQADYESNQVYFANTMYQNLDLYADANDKLLLSFDWKMSGDAPITDEIFKVGLGFASASGSIDYYDASGKSGFLFEQTGYGSGTFTAMLDPSFINQGGWTLEFQMLRGFDGLGTDIQIDNVSLQAISPVPEPSETVLFGTGLMMLYWVKRKTKTSFA